MSRIIGENKVVFTLLVEITVKRIGPDQPVGPVQPGTGPQAGPVFIIKPGVVKIDQEPVKTGKNQ